MLRNFIFDLKADAMLEFGAFVKNSRSARIMTIDCTWRCEASPHARRACVKGKRIPAKGISRHIVNRRLTHNDRS